jgi:hypothetical protein
MRKRRKRIEMDERRLDDEGKQLRRGEIHMEEIYR